MKSSVDKMSGQWRHLAALAFYATLTVSCFAANAAETLIYKSIDADGTPVFTDQPAPSATLVKPSPLNVMDAPRTQDATVTGTNPGADPTTKGTSSARATGKSGADAGNDANETIVSSGRSPAESDPAIDSTESSATNRDFSSVTDPASNSDTDPDASSGTTPGTSMVSSADSNLSADFSTVDTVSISSPLDRQTLIDPEGPLWVEFSTSPSTVLPKGMTAQVRLNDALVVTGGSTRLPMDVPERGAHRLQVTLVDVSGKAVAESAPIEIYVKLRSVAGSN